MRASLQQKGPRAAGLIDSLSFLLLPAAPAETGEAEAEKGERCGRGRFRFYVDCGACIFMTEPARTEGIAAKLWNDAKPLKG